MPTDKEELVADIPPADVFKWHGNSEHADNNPFRSVSVIALSQT